MRRNRLQHRMRIKTSAIDTLKPQPDAATIFLLVGWLISIFFDFGPHPKVSLLTKLRFDSLDWHHHHFSAGLSIAATDFVAVSRSSIWAFSSTSDQQHLVRLCSDSILISCFSVVEMIKRKLVAGNSNGVDTPHNKAAFGNGNRKGELQGLVSGANKSNHDLNYFSFSIYQQRW